MATVQLTSWRQCRKKGTTGEDYLRTWETAGGLPQITRGKLQGVETLSYTGRDRTQWHLSFYCLGNHIFTHGPERTRETWNTILQQTKLSQVLGWAYDGSAPCRCWVALETFLNITFGVGRGARTELWRGISGLHLFHLSLVTLALRSGEAKAKGRRMSRDKNKEKKVILLHYHGYKKSILLLKTFSVPYAFSRHKWWVCIIHFFFNRKEGQQCFSELKATLAECRDWKLSRAWAGPGVSQHGRRWGESWFSRGPLPLCLEFEFPNSLHPLATALVIDASAGSPQSQILIYITMGLPICLPISVFLGFLFVSFFSW